MMWSIATGTRDADAGVMKKTTRKLSLSTEQLRRLTNLELVRGGMIKPTGVSCDEACSAVCATDTCYCHHVP
jgi:hypothetical protein